MATGGCDENLNWSANKEEQSEELTALEAIFEENVNVISQPNDESDTLYTFKIDVPVILPNDNITIEVWAPYEYDIDDCQQIHANIPSPTRPNFSRSESGKRWHSTFVLSSLTPVCLVITLPKLYPSERSPEFSLSCSWLDLAQLSVLCEQLDKLWIDGNGMPVIYTWIDWLQHNTLSHLALDKSVILTPAEEDMKFDPRALPECTDLRESLLSVLEHDYHEEKAAFSKASHCCGICFDDKAGSEFFRLDKCLHHFCFDCMKVHCETHVEDGTVQQLKCPDHECDEQVPPHIVRSVLGAEAFDRWERLLLQKGLESMGDIEYCPRCQMPVIREPDTKLNLAHCTQCMYSFCTHCKDKWHAGEDCKNLLQKLASLEEASKQNVDKQETARLLKLEYMNIAHVQKISKPCPHCQSDIQKDGGCNKVTCSRCGKAMCWLCGSQIIGYEHFDTVCGLMANTMDVVIRVPRRTRHEGAVNVERRLREDPNAAHQLVKCPRCHQRNIRENRNNHLRCWCCKSNFCYMCKKCIIGNVMQHFIVGKPCDQHSDT